MEPKLPTPVASGLVHRSTRPLGRVTPHMEVDHWGDIWGHMEADHRGDIRDTSQRFMKCIGDTLHRVLDGIFTHIGLSSRFRKIPIWCFTFLDPNRRFFPFYTGQRAVPGILQARLARLPNLSGLTLKFNMVCNINVSKMILNEVRIAERSVSNRLFNEVCIAERSVSNRLFNAQRRVSILLNNKIIKISILPLLLNEPLVIVCNNNLLNDPLALYFFPSNNDDTFNNSFILILSNAFQI